MVKSQEERSANDVAVSIKLIGRSTHAAKLLLASSEARPNTISDRIFLPRGRRKQRAQLIPPRTTSFRPEHSHLRIFDPRWPFDIIARLGGFPHLRLDVAKFLLAARLIAAAVGPLLMAIGPTSFRLLRVSIAGFGVGVIGSSRLIANGRRLHRG